MLNSLLPPRTSPFFYASAVLFLFLLFLPALLSLISSAEPVPSATHHGSHHLVRRGLDTDFGVYVMNRTSRQRYYESSPFPVRFGMKLLFNTWLIYSPFIHLHLAIQTRNMGQEKDSPASASEIQGFVKEYQVDVSQLAKPDLTEYKTFNEFFSRPLAVGARPVDPNPSSLVSATDCRLTVFPTITQATQVWIKGRDFTIASLLGDTQLASHFANGSIAIFRLAPQDYHRFHSPVDGTILNNTDIAGTYYTVNPMVVRTDLDVFTENRRIVSMIQSPTFGMVAFVQIGALLVGSIVQTGVKQIGATVTRGEELGYFAYGGSTVVAVFEPGMVVFDADLVNSSVNAYETYVRVGERIGGATAGGSTVTAPQAAPAA